MGEAYDDIKFRQSCTEREKQYIQTVEAFSVEKDCKVILPNMQLNDNIVQPPSLSDTNMKVYDRHHNFQFPTYGQVKSRARTKYKKKPSVLTFIIIVFIIIWSCKCTLKKTRHFEFFFSS